MTQKLQTYLKQYQSINHPKKQSPFFNCCRGVDSQMENKNTIEMDPIQKIIKKPNQTHQKANYQHKSSNKKIHQPSNQKMHQPSNNHQQFPLSKSLVHTKSRIIYPTSNQPQPQFHSSFTNSLNTINSQYSEMNSRINKSNIPTFNYTNAVIPNNLNQPNIPLVLSTSRVKNHSHQLYTQPTSYQPQIHNLQSLNYRPTYQRYRNSVSNIPPHHQNIYPHQTNRFNQLSQR